eukprot:100451_1
MSSASYVLAEYNGQTRKIHGSWTTSKSYKNLAKQIRSKFGFEPDQEIEIKVFDKSNNKYFSIDRSEMNEIPKKGLIRVVMRGKKKPQKAKPKGSPLKPPGVPPYSKEDDNRRNQWQEGSKVEIYSEGQNKWQKGEILEIFNDAEGEWLVIKYAGFRTKEIQRFSNYIRPSQKKKKQPVKKSPKPAAKKEKKAAQYKKTEKQKQSESPKAKPKPKTKPKPKQPEKITTQSKYKKKERLPQPSPLKENEIQIKGNSSHIKKYIDRACVLLRGYDAKHKSGARDDDDDTKADDTVAKKYDVIELFGTGRAMGFVVSTAEIVKRIIGGLHQVTLLENIQQTDVWMPLEAGLREVETTRNMTQLRIILAVNEKDVDKDAKGYQAPIGVEAFAAHMEYHYAWDDEQEAKSNQRGRGGGKGGRGRGATRGRGGRRGSPRMRGRGSPGRGRGQRR